MRYKMSLIIAAMIAVLLAPVAVGAQAQQTCDGRVATIVGTSGDDILVGTQGDDVIVGLGGDDQIRGRRGNDIICGGDGNDLLRGNLGDDRVFGDAGEDRIIGNRGNDFLRGGQGIDDMSGKAGNDHVQGDQGADLIRGNNGEDTCIVQTVDTRIRTCEEGNSRGFRGEGDAAVRLTFPASFQVAQHCFTETACDNYFVAKVELDGSGNFDPLGIQAFDNDGNPIATYADVGDTYEGTFLFKNRPRIIEVDSGGGAWEITVVDAAALQTRRATANSSGNQVYRVTDPVATFGTAEATWDGFGSFAVIGVSPQEGRDLLVNEVRFQGQDRAPFSASASAQAGITIVQVLSTDGSWSVDLAG